MSQSGHAARIMRFAEMPSIQRGDGISSMLFVDKSTGSNVILCGLTLIPMGAGVPLHTHDADECVVILEGSAVCEVHDEHHTMAPYDMAFIPASVPHRFSSNGEGPTRILWIYSSAETTRTLVETGETTPHLAPLKAPDTFVATDG